MSHWNHRIVRRIDEEGEVVFGVHEAYYKNDEDQPHSWTVNPVEIEHNSLDELRGMLTAILAATDMPILDITEEEMRIYRV